MMMMMKLLLFVLVLICTLIGMHAQEVSEEIWKSSNVVHLTSDNFREFIDTNPSVLIMFYAPWCGHCKKLKHPYIDATTEVREFGGVLAAYDCTTQDKTLCTHYEVTGYPTLNYFKDGSFLYKYAGARSKESIIDFMRNPIAPPPPPVRAPFDDKQTDVAEITARNWRTYNARFDMLVMFYAPWCGHCKRTKPEFIEGAGLLRKNHPEMGRFASVDCTIEQSLCGRMEIQSYPTIKYFKKGQNNGVLYTGQRKSAEFVDFMVNPIIKDIPKNSPEVDLFTKDTSSVVILNDQDSFNEFTQQDSNTLVMFYAPWCGHCKKAKNNVIEAAKELKRTESKEGIAAMNCVTNKAFCSSLDIKGFPTFALYNNGKKEQFYAGPRDKDSIIAFLKDPSVIPEKKNIDSRDVKKASSKNGVKREAFIDQPHYVVELTEETFDSFIATDVPILVMYYAPWCMHCKKAKPSYAQAAERLNLAHSEAKMASVDCTVEKELCENKKITGYPTFMFYNKGNEINKYNEGRDQKSFFEFLFARAPGGEVLGHGHDEL